MDGDADLAARNPRIPRLRDAAARLLPCCLRLLVSLDRLGVRLIEEGHGEAEGGEEAEVKRKKSVAWGDGAWARVAGCRRGSSRNMCGGDGALAAVYVPPVRQVRTPISKHAPPG